MFGTRQHQEQQPAEQHPASCRRQGGGQRNALVLEPSPKEGDEGAHAGGCEVEEAIAGCGITLVDINL